MSDFIGYNVAEVNTLLSTVSKSYNSLGEYMSSGWSTVSSTMQNNWKGNDEQDYEMKLAKRMNDLYQNCTELVKASIDTISNLGESWVEFQKANVLQGGDVSATATNISFEVPTVEAYDMASIVKLNENTFSGDNLGLVSGGGETIKTAVTTYTDEIKSNVTNLYSEIDTSKAFLGTQSASVSDFLDAVGRAVTAMATDIEDMYTAIDTLTTTGYSQADTDAAQAMSSAATSADEAVSSSD